MGEAVRNLTSWRDVSASTVVFAIGNAAFAAFFIGKRAVLLLWLAFMAAFLWPLRDANAGDAARDGLAAVTEGLHAATDALKAVFAAVRERFQPPSY